MKRHVAPIIVAILLLLPVLYVGSYFALVAPTGVKIQDPDLSFECYTIGGHYKSAEPIAKVVFWPLEKIDRKVRPGRWRPEEDPFAGAIPVYP
jgi:hypothetical protein